METIKTYNVVENFYDKKLSNRVGRFFKAVVWIMLGVYLLTLTSSLLQDQAIKSMQMKNIQKYGDINGFKPVK